MNKKTLLIVAAIILVCAIGYITSLKKPAQTEQIQNTAATTKDCGIIDQKILIRNNNELSETEKTVTMKSLSCINQMLTQCAPAKITVNDNGKTVEITVVGQKTMGCNVSMKNKENATIACPLPSEYMTEIQKQFSTNNSDATIITKLATDITSEMASGNTSGNCTIIK